MKYFLNPNTQTRFQFVFIIFYLTGGRGYFREAWRNHQNHYVKKVREEYNSTYPIKSSRSIEYSLQDFNNYDKYEEKLKYASARLVELF